MRVSKNPYHPDIPLFLLLIPFISAFNYHLTYSNITVGWFLLITFLMDTVQGYCAWLAVRAIIIFFDRKLPYGDNPLKRILIQIATTTIAGLIVISILTELTSFIAKGKAAPLSFYTIDLLIISIWFLVINGIYIGLHYYKKGREAEEKFKEEQRLKSDGLVVRLGKQDLRLPFDQIAGFYVDGDYVAVCQFTGKRYIHDNSLDKLEQNLPTTLFFRLNRQYIVHHQLISGFKRSDNGKLQVMLRELENFPVEVTVSRTKAPAFKGWFRPE